MADCPDYPDCGDRCVCRFIGARGGNTKANFCCDCPTVPALQCFPASARTTIENGESVTMSDLRIGDKVAAGK